jgi:hypothetical protein
MANHFQRAVELLDEVEQARTALRAEYAKNGSARPNVVAGLHQTINVNMKLAHVHSQLAEAQALVDVGQMLDGRAGS